MEGKLLFVGVFVLAGAININVVLSSNIKGRLLTPDEGCGFSKVANSKIVGGAPAKPGAWPWMVLLGYNVSDGFDPFQCGGTLITSRHVLTAAHCVKDDLSFARLGEHDFLSTTDGEHQDIKVIGMEKHDKLNERTGANDIGILYLERDVEFTDRIRPICLPIDGPMQQKSFVDSNPFVAGWGMTQEAGPRSNILLQAQLPVIENSICRNLWMERKLLISGTQFNEAIICAGQLSGGVDICNGDSGGPLMLPVFENGKFPFYQIGITSFQHGCGQENTPGAYTKIQYYADWIKEKLAK